MGKYKLEVIFKLTTLDEAKTTQLAQMLSVAIMQYAKNCVMFINNRCMLYGLPVTLPDLTTGADPLTISRLAEATILGIIAAEGGVYSAFSSDPTTADTVAKKFLRIQCDIEKAKRGNDSFESLCDARSAEYNGAMEILDTDPAKSKQLFGEAITKNMQLPFNQEQNAEFMPDFLDLFSSTVTAIGEELAKSA